MLGAASASVALLCLTLHPFVAQVEMARFSGMQYCKTDLIAAKGIVFIKYSKSSSACLAMETIQEAGMVSLSLLLLPRWWCDGGGGRSGGGACVVPRWCW